MNPMVDLAFLLVTFFMLTTTFRTVEPVQVDMPESQSENVLPESDVLTILASADGRTVYPC
jgi:biopolymer transport protein ExbD